MPFEWAGLAISAYGAYSSSQNSSGGGDPVNTADPFNSQRGQYQGQLSTFMGQPMPSILTGTPGASGFTPTDPSYQFRMQQGLDSVSRNQAAGGMLHSGNRLGALEQYGQGLASQEYGAEYARQASTYDQQYQRLAQLSGATIGSPGTAGTLQAQQNAASSASWQQLAGKGVSAVQSWYNGSSGGGDYGGGNTNIASDASGSGFF